MKDLQVFFLIVFSICFFSCQALDNFRLLYPDYNLSLARHGRSQNHYRQYYERIDTNAPPQYFLYKELFKNLYDFDKSLTFSDKKNYQIPRIIHQIWLGGPFPEKYKEWAATWQNWEGWEYILWTDENVKDLDLYNSQLYQEATNYGEKADILRYELLNKFGGIYVDIDMKCVSPDFFLFAHQEYSFFAGLEPLECDRFSLGNAILASTPGHPLMEIIVMEIAEHSRIHQNEWIVERTGPRYITKKICENWELVQDNGLIFPPTFFYPILGNEISRWKLIRRHECAAIHFWEGSWLN